MNEKVISEENYFEYLNSNNLNDEEIKEIEAFENQMFECMKYQDYLVGEHKKEFYNYSHKISKALEEVQENEDKYSYLQKKAVEKYSYMIEEAKNFQDNKMKNENKLILKKEKKSGYINAFMVILSVLACGIIMGIALYFTI